MIYETVKKNNYNQKVIFKLKTINKYQKKLH